MPGRGGQRQRGKGCRRASRRCSACERHAREHSSRLPHDIGIRKPSGPVRRLCQFSKQQRQYTYCATYDEYPLFLSPRPLCHSVRALGESIAAGVRAGHAVELK